MSLDQTERAITGVLWCLGLAIAAAITGPISWGTLLAIAAGTAIGHVLSRLWSKHRAKRHRPA
jgi:uncharacterized membrane protein YczE